MPCFLAERSCSPLVQSSPPAPPLTISGVRWQGTVAALNERGAADNEHPMVARACPPGKKSGTFLLAMAALALGATGALGSCVGGSSGPCAPGQQIACP